MESHKNGNRLQVSATATGLPSPTEPGIPRNSADAQNPLAQSIYKPSAEELGVNSKELELLMMLQKSLEAMTSFAKKKKNMFLEIKEGLEGATYAMNDLIRLKLNQGRQNVTALSTTTQLSNGDQIPTMLTQAPQVKCKRGKGNTSSPETSPLALSGPAKKSRNNQDMTPSQSREGPTYAEMTAKKQNSQAQIPRQDQTSKGEKRRRLRNEAILIATVDKNQYAEVVRKLRQKVDPTTHGVEIRRIRQTRRGDILVEVEAEKQNKRMFEEALQEAVGEEGTVKDLVPRAYVEIRDMDQATDEQEITNAVRNALNQEGIQIGDIKVRTSNRSFRGLIRAEIEMSEKEASTLARQGRVKIGWLYCRVRLLRKVTRCYKCHGFGHISSACKGTDRSGKCWRCGGSLHKGSECTNKPHCLPCEDASDDYGTDHVPGSGKCKAFLEQLKRVKDRGLW